MRGGAIAGRDATTVGSPFLDDGASTPQGDAMNRTRCAAALLALCAAGAAAFAGAASTSAQAPKKGGILRIGTISGYDSMNPFVAFSAQSYGAFIMQYPTLVQYR